MFIGIGMPLTKPNMGGGGVSYATWNPADKGTQPILSNANKTVTGNGSWGMVRSTISKSSGKHYVELTISNALAANGMTIVGVATSTAGLNVNLGSDATGWGWQDTNSANSFKLNNGVQTTYGAPGYVAGDIIGIALDADAKTVEFLKNNVSQGIAFSGLGTGPFFIACSQFQGTEVLTANFGATPFTYSVPVGFNAGLYN